MNKKIKIGFFISNLSQGGAENQFLQLIKGINKQIFDVHVVLYAYQTEAFFIEIFSIKNISVTTNKLKYSFFLFKIIFNPSYPCLKLEDLSKNTENTDFAGICP